MKRSSPARRWATSWSGSLSARDPDVCALPSAGAARRRFLASFAERDHRGGAAKVQQRRAARSVTKTVANTGLAGEPKCGCRRGRNQAVFGAFFRPRRPLKFKKKQLLTA